MQILIINTSENSLKYFFRKIPGGQVGASGDLAWNDPNGSLLCELCEIKFCCMIGKGSLLCELCEFKFCCMIGKRVFAMRKLAKFSRNLKNSC